MTNREITLVVNGNLNLLRCFSGRGISSMVVASDAQDLVLCSRYARRQAVVADLKAQPQEALRQLLELGAQLPGRPVLAFDNEPMMLLVSRNREALERHYRFLLPEAELVEDLADKVRFDGLARRLDLPTPRTITSRSVASADEALAALSLPCMFKPVTHVGWYQSEVVAEEGARPFKALLARSAEQFRRRWEKMRRHCGDFVVQEFIPGGDDCIYSFHAYLNGEGRPLGWYVGRKIRTYPKTSGMSTYLELVKEPRLVEIGLDILARMKFVGPVKLDFKKDEHRDRYYLLEVNSRFNLWNHLGMACGINLPLMAYRDWYGQAVTPATAYRTNIRWLAMGNDLRAFVQDYHRDGELSWGRWLWSLRGRKVYDVFAWRDPWPCAVTILRYLGEWWKKSGLRLRRAGKGSAPTRPASTTGRTVSNTVP